MVRRDRSCDANPKVFALKTTPRNDKMGLEKNECASRYGSVIHGKTGKD